MHVQNYNPRRYSYYDWIRAAVKHYPKFYSLGKDVLTAYQHSHGSSSKVKKTSVVTPHKMTRKHLRSEEPESSDNHNSDLTSRPVHTVVHEKTSVDVNGNQRLSIVENPKGHFGNVGKYKSIMNVLFPRGKYTELSNGTHLGVSTGSTTTSQQGTLLSSVDKQAMYIFRHLPIIDPNGYSTGQSLQDIYQRALSLQQLSGFSISNALNPGDEGGKSTSIESTYFCYHGGYTLHTFLNNSNMDAHIKIEFCRPKLYCSNVIQPILLAEQDYIYNQIYDTTGTTIPVSTDLNFKFTKDCRSLHYHYNISKPKNLIVHAGSEFTVMVRHPPFKYCGAPWLQSFVSNTTANASNSNPDLAPFCTVDLVITVKGSFGAITAGATGDASNYMEMSPMKIYHVQREVHRYRCLMGNEDYTEVNVNSLKNTATVVGTMDPDDPGAGAFNYNQN